MADWGILFVGSNGMLVTSDSPCYEFYASYYPESRTQNISVYTVRTPEYPLVFINCGGGNAAGILSITGASGAWSVTVLSNVSCPVDAFIPVAGTASGFGVATYDANRRLLFASSRRVLNVRGAAGLSEGGGFSPYAVVDSISFVSGAVKPTTTSTARFSEFEHFSHDMVYGCRDVLSCGMETVNSFTCGADMFGNFSCGFVPTSQFVCGYKSVCGMELVTSRIYLKQHYTQVDWALERGVARISGGAVYFDWMLHLYGTYYVKGHLEGWPSTSSNAPVGYIPPYSVMSAASVASVVPIPNDSVFPYTSSRANSGPLTCLASLRSDYE